MDLTSYRASESLGRQAVRSIRNSAIHDPEAFEDLKFPIRITCHEDLASYIDVMHEDHFELFMSEFDGFSDDELDEFIRSLINYCHFFMANFGSKNIPLPIAGMISQYCIFRKIRGTPGARNILEIGPGSGLVSFFMSNAEDLDRYDQIETAEAFYLLQTLIGRYLYGHAFVEHAQIDAAAAGLGDIGLSHTMAIRPNILDFREETFSIDVERVSRSAHFPWWRLHRVFDHRYDVVTSNANLTEFSMPALRYYSALARTVLKPTGIFLAQCLGGGATEPKLAVKTFMEAGFVPLAMTAKYQDQTSSPPAHRQLAMVNLVLLPPGHPSLGQVGSAMQGGALINVGDPLTRSIFSMDRPSGRKITQREIVELVRGRL